MTLFVTDEKEQEEKHRRNCAICTNNIFISHSSVLHLLEHAVVYDFLPERAF
jgi:hypothetical protein